VGEKSRYKSSGAVSDKRARRGRMWPRRWSLTLAVSGLVGCGSSGASTADRDSGLFDADRLKLDVATRHETGSKMDAASPNRDGAAGEDGGADAVASDGGLGDATSGNDASDDGPHAPQPQVINYGGTVLMAPTVQPIVYAMDTMGPDVQAMIVELAGSATWATATSEYGVGPLTVLPAIVIAGTPPTSLDDNGSPSPFQTTLASNLSGASPAWGAADASTIYAFLLPSGTNITSSGSCCSDYLGYHDEATVGSIQVPYAIMCDCGAEGGFPLTALQWVTTTVSHELEEAATDPFPFTNPAYYGTDDNDFVWTFATGGEVADMCDDNADSNLIPPGSTYMVQRSWSNAAAMGGTNPCVPVPADGPFFNSMPVLGPVTLTYYGQPIMTTGVQLAVGASTTIDIQLYSAGPTSDPWTVTAYDLAEFTTGGSAQNQLSLNKTTGSNGDILKLTIKALAPAPNGGGFIITSDLGGQENLSMGTVTN
jgi:hypothetical protein